MTPCFLLRCYPWLQLEKYFFCLSVALYTLKKKKSLIKKNFFKFMRNLLHISKYILRLLIFFVLGACLPIIYILYKGETLDMGCRYHFKNLFLLHKASFLLFPFPWCFYSNLASLSYHLFVGSKRWLIISPTLVLKCAFQFVTQQIVCKFILS